MLSLWAGVEGIVDDPTLTVPLCRMVDEGLTRGMAEWVAAHVLRYHVGTDAHVLGQDGVWRNGVTPPLAPDRTVAILGLGEIGRVVAATVAGLGFDVRGWSRRRQTVAGIVTGGGEDGLEEVLREADIVVLLLPATPETENVLDARTLAMLPAVRGSSIPGAAPLIDDAALLAALDSGHVAHATLDVFREEPLPPDHPYWKHPRVTVTPHIAAETRPETASSALSPATSRAARRASPSSTWWTGPPATERYPTTSVVRAVPISSRDPPPQLGHQLGLEPGVALQPGGVAPRGMRQRQEAGRKSRQAATVPVTETAVRPRCQRCA